jgi:hypothetical protein
MLMVNIDDSLIKLHMISLHQAQKFLSRFEYCAKTITTVLFYRGNSSDSFFFILLADVCRSNRFFIYK